MEACSITEQACFAKEEVDTPAVVVTTVVRRLPGSRPEFLERGWPETEAMSIAFGGQGRRLTKVPGQVFLVAKKTVYLVVTKTLVVSRDKMVSILLSFAHSGVAFEASSRG